MRLSKYSRSGNIMCLSKKGETLAVKSHLSIPSVVAMFVALLPISNNHTDHHRAFELVVANVSGRNFKLRPTAKLEFYELDSTFYKSLERKTDAPITFLRNNDDNDASGGD